MNYKCNTKIKTIAVCLLMAGSSLCYSDTPKTDTAKILRCINSKTGKIENLGDVEYFVSGDTLYISHHFSTCSIIYSNNKTKKMILKQESYYVKNKKHGWWYVIIKKSPDAPKNAYVSMIILRNCLDIDKSKNRICCDAHLYNISRESKRGRTFGAPTSSVQKLLKLL